MTVESFLVWLLAVVVSGLIVGAVARLLVPGPNPIGILGTIGAGIAGSFLGGLVGRLLFGASLSFWVNLLLAVLGAALVIFLLSGRRRGLGGGFGRGGLGRGRDYYDDDVAVDRGYGFRDRVLVDDRPALRRRRRFF
jgi:uncharacterized membrane protein YeaQ/YmgE (transglycosylase-associated protein family)